jgi:hypothetical protein
MTTSLIEEVRLARERVAFAVAAYDRAVRAEGELLRRLDETRAHTGRMMVEKQDAIAEVRRLQEALLRRE